MPTVLQPGTPAELKKERQITGRFVLLTLIGFFGVVISVNTIMARFAVSTFGGVETESAYKAGLQFSRDAQAAHVQEALGWNVDGSVRRNTKGEAVVEIDARDAAGHTLDGLEVGVELHHPADARRDLKLAARQSDAGHYLATAGLAAGQWILKLDIAKDGKPAFRSLSRVAVP